MNPLSLRYLIGAGILAAVTLLAYWQGYAHEKRKFDEFIAQTKSVAAIQEAINDSTVKQHERDKEDIHNDYQTRLANLRSQYSGGVQHSPGSGHMPTPSTSTGGTDAAARYNELAAKCAETTLQLTELQDWVKRTSR